MSLRAFHIFFILASIALSVLFGAWARQSGQGAAMSVAAFMFAAGMTGYLIWFLKKK